MLELDVPIKDGGREEGYAMQNESESYRRTSRFAERRQGPCMPDAALLQEQPFVALDGQPKPLLAS